MRLPAGQRTPMLKQYMAIKNRHPDAVLFYRMGDFFEMFYDDARIASEVLGLRLTSRAHGKADKVPLAGFPYHQLDNYLTRLVKAGHRVVIVEQVEDPKTAKGLVKRDVVQVVTAGTNTAAVDDEAPESTRIAALRRLENRWGFAWADVSTGEFKAGEFSSAELEQVVGAVAPVELVVPESDQQVGPSPGRRHEAQVVSTQVDWVWEPTFARQTLLNHFGTVGLKGFGLEERDLAVSAAGALLHYLKGNLQSESRHITSLARAEVRGVLLMERSTRRNLELYESLSGNDRATLFAVMDRTVTRAGRRLLYNRMMEPLADRALIEERLDAVAEMVADRERLDRLRDLLKRSGDLQRYLARLATGRGSARDLVAVRETLGLVPEYKQLLGEVSSHRLQALAGMLDELGDLRAHLEAAVVDEPPLATTEGGIIRDGWNPGVDELRLIARSGRSWLTKFEKEERARTGINNLKVAYNRVFGYYIEVSKANQDKVPQGYIRRQTLVNAERFTTVELQEYEGKLVSAEEDLARLEGELYSGLVAETLKHSPALQENARALAELDATASNAVIAQENDYCRPQVHDDDRLELEASRHPVVEKMLDPGEGFIPNDLVIGGDDARILIVTGPNMAGKSTYLRQVALAVIMAQMGSFIPAKRGRIGVVDKLFTRIGALDNLAGGESTFLVEMQETASILNNATPRSLVLFDEVGRGTSTFDGLSLAWAIVEYLHQTPALRPRTLFATHFHEMVDLERFLPGVKNLNVAVREYRDRIVFLRRIIPGGSDRSFGIHVARMAGLPPAVVSRARDILANLEANDLNPVAEPNSLAGEDEKDKKPQKGKKGGYPKARLAQLSFFDPLDNEIREALKAVDPETTSPLEALRMLMELKDKLKDS